jgi:putative DNA primase/helicase
VANDLASTLASLLVHEKGAGFKPDIFDRLVAAYMDSDGSIWMDVERVLKASGPGVWDNYRKRIKQRAHDLASIRTIGRSDDDTKTIRARWVDAPVSSNAEPPPNWTITSDKAVICRLERKSRDGVVMTNEVHVSYAPVVITKRVQQKETGAVMLELAWRTGMKWHARVFERDIIFSSRKIVDCAKWGMPISSHNASEMVQWLEAYENHNLHAIAIGYAQSSMGWLGEEDDLGHHGFLCGETQIGGNGQRIEYDGDCSNEFRQGGTFEGWNAAVKPLMKWPILRTMLCGALAAPLVGIVGAPNCCIEVVGPSSAGKSVSLRVARSAFCSVRTKLPTWNTTVNGLEARVQAFNDLPFFIDDTAEVPESKRKDLLGAAIYMLESGHTRTRATKDLGQRQVKTWRTVVLSSGEYSLSDYVGTGGAAARVLSFWGSPLGPATEETGRSVAKALGQLSTHFGHAGPLFIKWLWANQEKWEDFSCTYQILVDEVRRQFSDNAAMRLSESVALLELTRRLVAEALDLDWLSDSFFDKGFLDEVFSSAIGKSIEDANKAKSAWHHMISVAEAHRDRWTGWGDVHKGHEPPGGWFGWKLVRPKPKSEDPPPDKKKPEAPGDDLVSDLLAWHPSQLRRVLMEGGFPVDATLRSWRSSGVLLSYMDRVTCSVECQGSEVSAQRVNLVKRNRTVWDDDDE